jgi:acyl carrier protein
MQVDNIILKKVYDILKPFVPEGQQIREETDLVVDMGLDSLKVMKILENIEDDFDISIPLNILPDVRTVKDLVLQIQKIAEDE